MPVEVDWYLENRIINLKYIGDVDMQDISESAQNAYRLLEASTANYVHALQDATDLTSLPRNLKAIHEAVEVAYTHPRVGWVIAHNISNPFFRFIANTITQLTGSRFRIVPTQADALAWLQSRDSTLSNLTEPLLETNPPSN